MAVVSVIIPTYNRVDFLKEAVDSVLDQAYPEVEVIVVDDGSTDGTPDLLARYGEAVRIIRQDNAGVSAARNAGIRRATGRLIALLDSDDLWLPGKLAAQTAFFDRHPESVICQTEELWVRRGRRVNPGKRHRKRAGWIFVPSLSLCLVSPSAVMLRRSLLDEVGLFDESLPACEDYDLWLRVARRHPIDLIETPLIVKRGGRPDQLSAAPGLDRYRIQSILKILEGEDLPADYREAAITVLVEKCRIYANGCFKRGRRDEGRRCMALADRYAALREGDGDGRL
jgi:glycosyltransferase involved in cell wall biosynthesis